MNSSASTWAVFERRGNQPTRVLYSHLDEATARRVSSRQVTRNYRRGVGATHVWAEEHAPDAVYVINN